MEELKTKKIKVCQVSAIAFAIRFLLLNQIKDLQKKGYQVSVVCSPGKWVKTIEKEDIRVKPVLITRKITPLSDLIALFKLISYFKEEKFDIVHTNTPKAGLLGSLAAKIAGNPIIIHNNLGFYFHEGSSRLSKKLFAFFEKLIGKNVDLVFSVDQEDIETAIKENIYPPEKIKYLGGWVDLERFNPDNFSSDFIEKKKKELGISSQVKVLGIVARLVKEKGHFDLFNAFSQVLKQFPKAMLLVVGPREPEKRDRIEPKIVRKFGIKRNVLFLDERTDVEEIYALMDIFILPSYREGIGISLLEASAMKKPIIATNIRGCREAVEDNKTGILVPLKNPEKLAQAIIYLLKNPEKAKKMGQAGRVKIKREFDQRLVFDRIEKEYTRLIKEKL